MNGLQYTVSVLYNPLQHISKPLCLSHTFLPACLRARASSVVMVLLPTPPFPDRTNTTCRTWARFPSAAEQRHMVSAPNTSGFFLIGDLNRGCYQEQVGTRVTFLQLSSRVQHSKWVRGHDVTASYYIRYLSLWRFSS